MLPVREGVALGWEMMGGSTRSEPQAPLSATTPGLLSALSLPPQYPDIGAVPLQVEIKPDMIGGYLAEYSISYKPVKHGKPGIGATHSSRFIPLK